jgi:hypothetical protein
MHQYPDGLTGLAAFCDICDEQITETGYVVWNTQDPNDWLLVHHSRCDPGGPRSNYRYGSSMSLSAELIYLANSAGVDLTEALNEVHLLDSIG